jgi:TrmH family RNA methyltransferase
MDSPVCLVLGSEGKGLSATALQHCAPVAIPMAGDMESLNVGIAGGILMFLLSSGLEPLVQRLRRAG